MKNKKQQQRTTNRIQKNEQIQTSNTPRIQLMSTVSEWAPLASFALQKQQNKSNKYGWGLKLWTTQKNPNPEFDQAQKFPSELYLLCSLRKNNKLNPKNTDRPKWQTNPEFEQTQESR